VLAVRLWRWTRAPPLRLGGDPGIAGVRARVLGESRDDEGGEALEERGRPPTSAPTEERDEVEWLW
jgi:hypothetical protein